MITPVQAGKGLSFIRGNKMDSCVEFGFRDRTGGGIAKEKCEIIRLKLREIEEM